jgi:hypothetical protein
MTPERRLYGATVIFLAIYIPGETYISRSNLLSPFYLVDVVGMALLLGGVLKRGSAFSAPLLVAGYAWSGAVAWRGMADRLRAAAENRYGWVEADSTRILVVGAILILLAALATRAAIRLSAESIRGQAHAVGLDRRRQ